MRDMSSRLTEAGRPASNPTAGEKQSWDLNPGLPTPHSDPASTRAAPVGSWGWAGPLSSRLVLRGPSPDADSLGADTRTGQQAWGQQHTEGVALAGQGLRPRLRAD